MDATPGYAAFGATYDRRARIESAQPAHGEHEPYRGSSIVGCQRAILNDLHFGVDKLRGELLIRVSLMANGPSDSSIVSWWPAIRWASTFASYLRSDRH